MVDSPGLSLAGDADHVPKHQSVWRHNRRDYMYAALTYLDDLLRVVIEPLHVALGGLIGCLRRF